MITEEVSLVDRAANKRRFLLFKRDEKHMAHGSEITPGADGTYSAGGAGAPAGAAAPASAAPAIVGKAGASLTQDQKDALGEAVASALDSLTNAQALIEGATIVPDETGTSADELVTALQDGAGMIEDTLAAMLGAEESPEDEEAEAPPEGEPPPEMPAPPGMPMGKRLEVVTAKRKIMKYEGEKLGLSLIAKYGARMAKTRLARFKTAIGILGEILGEMAPAVKAAIKSPAPGEKKPAPGAAEKTKKNDAPAAEDAEKAALQKRGDEAVAVAKSLAAQLAALRGNVQPSNGAAPPSGSARASADPPWPSDMNDSR